VSNGMHTAAAVQSCRTPALLAHKDMVQLHLLSSLQCATCTKNYNTSGGSLVPNARKAAEAPAAPPCQMQPHHSASSIAPVQAAKTP
jgi:hypothetical protein